ncbi:MAG: cation transporter [candidate division WS1 bacterium]|nr:cation transporter [candidate division WS1 bacterium]
MDQQRREQNVALVSVGSNLTLVIAKGTVGLAIGSVSVLSEALHSGMDLVAALIALFAVRSSGRPADEEHPFGHGKVENVSGMIEALLIFGAAIWIILEAAKKLLNPEPPERLGLGVILMLASVVINYFVSGLLFREAERSESPALEADGWHLRTDVWTSAGVMAGLGVIWLGERWLPRLDLGWVDPVVALMVALLIMRAAWQLTARAGRDLLDAGLPETERWVAECLAKQGPPVRGFHHLRTRRAGSTRFVELHLWVDGQMSVEDSHQLGDNIVREIKGQFPNSHVVIHTEPYHGEEGPEEESRQGNE